MEFVQLEGLSDRYDQITQMAIGGMAEIYRARQINLDRPVAIKRIRPELKNNPDIQERFKREAKASANLLHHNLAHVYEYIESQESSYIVMEYIDGVDNSEVIGRSAPLPIDVSISIAIKTLQGLAYIHSHGMVHRDIKPENIRLTNRGEVKIMDFGIAFDPGISNLTMPGVLIGSPHYLAPEQISGKKIDQRVDIFAFGITFYEMLTGKRPFVETDTETVFTRIQKGEYLKIESIRSDISPFLIRIVDDCLQVNPHKRASSAKRLSEALQSYMLQNYSLSTEARVKQFLMKEKFMAGDPSLVEVEEKTRTHGLTIGAQRKKGFLWILFLVAAITLCAVVAMKKYAFLSPQKTSSPEE